MKRKLLLIGVVLVIIASFPLTALAVSTNFDGFTTGTPAVDLTVPGVSFSGVCQITETSPSSLVTLTGQMLACINPLTMDFTALQSSYSFNFATLGVTTPPTVTVTGFSGGTQVFTQGFQGTVQGTIPSNAEGVASNSGIPFDRLVVSNTLNTPFGIDNLNTTAFPPGEQGIAIDIKFCSDPNAFNCKKRGVLPLTIFGTDSFDVLDVDISTLRLCRDDTGDCIGPPTDFSIDDRGDPTTDLGASQCALVDTDGDGVLDTELHTLNPDGFLDLDAAFDAGDVQALLADFCSGPKSGVSATLFIEGETFDGTPIESIPVGNTGTDQLVKKNR